MFDDVLDNIVAVRVGDELRTGGMQFSEDEPALRLWDLLNQPLDDAAAI